MSGSPQIYNSSHYGQLHVLIYTHAHLTSPWTLKNLRINKSFLKGEVWCTPGTPEHRRQKQVDFCKAGRFFSFRFAGSNPRPNSTTEPNLNIFLCTFGFLQWTYCMGPGGSCLKEDFKLKVSLGYLRPCSPSPTPPKKDNLLVENHRHVIVVVSSVIFFPLRPVV